MSYQHSRDPYLYSDVPVLKNIPGVKDSEQLKKIEGDITRITMSIVYSKDYEKFNTETLQDIHRTIFGSIIVRVSPFLASASLPDKIGTGYF